MAGAAADDATCNGLDEDCDGTADEDYVIDASCGVGECQTNNTPSSCVAGVESVCTAGTAAAEICDNLDNSCDGGIDEGCNDDGDGYCDNTMTVSGAPVPVCTDSVDGPGDDCDDNDPEIYPGGHPVRITTGGLPLYYPSLQHAYNAISDGQSIQSQDKEFIENFSINADKSITLKAGYDCGYSINSGMTTITGTMTVTEGIITIQSGILIIQ
jgi:hypothetical protein